MPLASNASRRTFLRRAAGQAAVLSMSPMLKAATAPTVQPPNVIFVLVDDVGYGDFACHGNPYIKTPNIDALHAKSVRFTDYHVSPTCSPTRASLMTGRENNLTGVWHTINGRSLLDPREVTMADCFRQSGYRTGIFGKWHLGDNYPLRPQDRGFEEVAVCGGGGVWQTPDYFGNDYFDDVYFHNGKPVKSHGFCTDVWFDLASSFILESKHQARPFFCYLATNAAHMPMWSPESFSAPYQSIKNLNKPGFYGMIANVDENMGKLYKLLEAQGLLENTILIFSTDNGTDAGDRVYNASMRGKKASPYEGGHRVPFFMHWPAGELSGGRDIDTLTAHIDVLPTLADLCNLKNHGQDVHGRSLKPLLHAAKAPPAWPDRTIVVDSQREELLIKWKEAAVMNHKWRLVNPSLNGDASKCELYDIAKDPGQATNLAAQHPDRVASMMAEYECWWERTSIRADEYVRIALGALENPSRLTCHDWHGDAGSVWNQKEIRTAPKANGFWAVDIRRSGQYKIELRRWPKEVDLPLNGIYVNTKENLEQTQSTAIHPVQARVIIAGQDERVAVTPEDKYATFTLSLEKGWTELRTWFYEADGIERGAYYAYVERLQ